MNTSSNTPANSGHNNTLSQDNSSSMSFSSENTSPAPISNKHKDERRTLMIILGALFIMIVILTCAIILIHINNSSRDNDGDEVSLQDDDENSKIDKNNKASGTNDVDCSHSEIDLKTLTGEDNPNVYNATTYLRTDSRYLCIEDWGIALSLTDNIDAIIYTPVNDSTADYISHRVSIKAVIDENNNVNWGGNYMPDSYFSALAVLERAETEKMDYIKNQYGITDSDDVFLKTDKYTYFIHKARGKNYIDYYKLLSNGYEKDSFDIPEAFYDDILLVDDFVSDFNNYHVYDESKT